MSAISKICCLTVAIGAISFTAYAFNATSTDFFVRQDVLNTTGGNNSFAYSTSTDFKSIGAGGQTATGTSTSSDFGLLGGFLRSLYKGPAPSYEQIHYHWRNDNGSEVTASSTTGGIQDTAITSVSKGSIERLRVEVANHGGTIKNYANQNFGLQYGILSSTCGNITLWTNVGSSTVSNVDWVIGSSSNITSGADTTNIAVASGGVTDTNHTFLTPNGGIVNKNGTTTAAIFLPSDSFIELEYSLVATTTATAGATYCFRVENASSTSNYLYTVYPQATITSGAASLSASIDSLSETFPSLTPGFYVSTSSVISVKTTNSSGFNVTVSRQNVSSSTLLLSGNSSVSIPDNTPWVQGTNCATGGNAISSTTNPNTLQFRVQQTGTDSGNYCSAWWGSDDTPANAVFAGFPTTTQKIVNRSSSSAATTSATVLYNINASSLQQTGTYSGTIIYTVTANP